jgi:phosphomannomutase
LCKEKSGKSKIVIGRDARVSGPLVSKIVSATLQSIGIDVVDLGLSTTPTVEIAVTLEKAAGGIIITASHNPAQWNALKLLNEAGEFISAEDGETVLSLAEGDTMDFAQHKDLGSYTEKPDYLEKHIDMIVGLPLVDAEAIEAKNFNLIIDCVNSSGGIAVPMLLKALGVTQTTELFCEPNGHFSTQSGAVAREPDADLSTNAEG